MAVVNPSMFEEDAFDLLSLDPQFDLSPQLLEKAYLTLQKSTHPDEFTAQSEMMRRAAANHSSRINHAYQQLKNPLIRAELLLKRQRFWPIPPCQTTLQEAMDLREEGLETEDQAAFQKKVDVLIQESERHLSDALTKKAGAQASREYLRLSYLRKLKES